MSVPPIPNELKILSELEIHLLCRIVPFLKIICLNGPYGQFGLRGQAILFAQEIEEVAEQLPLSANKMKMILIGESLEYVKKYKEYTISVNNVHNALLWLITNNTLYKSVKINLSEKLNELHPQLVFNMPSSGANPKDGKPKPEEPKD